MPQQRNRSLTPGAAAENGDYLNMAGNGETENGGGPPVTTTTGNPEVKVKKQPSVRYADDPVMGAAGKGKPCVLRKR